VSPAPLVRHELVEGGVGVVTLADPDRRNALSPALVADLAAAVEAVVGSGAGAMVLTAEPPVFCAGGSLDELLAPTVPLEDTYAGLRALDAVPIVTVAAVGGPAIGAGVNLPLACDVIVASPDARFDPRWLDVGIHPGGGHLWRLEQRVGRQAASALVLCGESLDGQSAARTGLAWRCVPAADLLPTALGMARKAASRDRELTLRAKATLDALPSQQGLPAATGLELATQRWSMTRPTFHARVSALRARGQRRS
jgi:enoyl-CoA hydratase